MEARAKCAPLVFGQGRPRGGCVLAWQQQVLRCSDDTWTAQTFATGLLLVLFLCATSTTTVNMVREARTVFKSTSLASSSPFLPAFSTCCPLSACNTVMHHHHPIPPICHTLTMPHTYHATRLALTALNPTLERGLCGGWCRRMHFVYASHLSMGLWPASMRSHSAIFLKWPSRRSCCRVLVFWSALGCSYARVAAALLPLKPAPTGAFGGGGGVWRLPCCAEVSLIVMCGSALAQGFTAVP